MKKFDIEILNKYVIETDIVCEKHPSSDLYLYGYYHEFSADSKIVWDNVNVHCRGMIVNSKGEVVERPFSKFWTFRQYISNETILLSDNQIFKLPKCGYRITEKIDGTMVTLYWIDDKPFLATQRSFTNIKAHRATEILYKKYSNTFSQFNRNYTYIFEAVYPEVKVLIDYGDTINLFLIGIIDKKTGLLLPLEDIGFPIAKDYTKEYGHIENFDELLALDIPNQEGFVIHYDNGELIKIKFPWYKLAHNLLDKMLSYNKRMHIVKGIMRKKLNCNNTNPRITSHDVWQCLKENDNNLNSILTMVTDYYYMFGFEYWKENQKENILNAYKELEEKEPHLSKIQIWNMIEPAGDSCSVFDIDFREQNPHIYETIIWNWEKRFL